MYIIPMNIMKSKDRESSPLQSTLLRKHSIEKYKLYCFRNETMSTDRDSVYFFIIFLNKSAFRAFYRFHGHGWSRDL